MLINKIIFKAFARIISVSDNGDYFICDAVMYKNEFVQLKMGKCFFKHPSIFINKKIFINGIASIDKKKLKIYAVDVISIH